MVKKRNKSYRDGNFISNFVLKLRRRETPFFKFIYKIAKYVLKWNFPYIPWLHKMLYAERVLRTNFFKWLGVKLYYEPLFKSQCVKVGKNFHIVRGNIQGIPYISGKLYMKVGDDVTIHSVTTFAGGKVYDQPRLIIGNKNYIGSKVTFNVAKEIAVGNNCYFADNIIIRDNDGHPLDPEKRKLNLPVDRSDIKPVKIGNDVWVSSNVVILKGVTIGNGAVIASGAIVTKDVDPLTIVGGNPARALKKIG